MSIPEIRLRRWMHKVYAFAFGYFWLPCPECGRWFGGHEEGGGTLWVSGTKTSRSGHLLCPNCPGDRFAPDYSPDAIREVLWPV